MGWWLSVIGLFALGVLVLWLLFWASAKATQSILDRRKDKEK